MSSKPTGPSEEAMRARRALKDYEASITEKIQEAAGETLVKRVALGGHVGPNPPCPQRKDYQNRAEFRAACAKWRQQC